MTQLPRILEIYENARDFMARSGNPDQWGRAYPPEEMIRQDILNEKCYVNLHDEQIAAVFYFSF